MKEDFIKAMIKKHEGYRNRIYLDSLGKPTCGYGHLLAEDTQVPLAASEAFFEQDYRVAFADCVALILEYEIDLTENRKAVLINMLFNMGIGRVRGFKKMFAALQDRDYKEAAVQMLESRWALQVKGRAIELSELMEEG